MLDGRWMKSARVIGLLGLAACAASPPPVQVVAAEQNAAIEARRAAAVPHDVPDLAAAVPGNAGVFVNVPGIEKLASLMGLPVSLGLDLMLGGAANAIASQTGIDAASVHALLRAYDGAVAWLVTDKTPTTGGVVLRFRERGAVEAVLAKPPFDRVDEHRFHARVEGRDVQLAWFPAPRVVIVSEAADAVADSMKALAGEAPSFAASKLHAPARAAEPWATLDLHRVAPQGSLDEGSHAVASLTQSGAGTDLDVRVALLGSRVPRLGAVVASSAPKLLGRLPANAAVGLSLSVDRRPGKTLAEALDEIGKPSGACLSCSASQALPLLGGASLADLDRAIGSEIAFGVYLDPNYQVSFDDEKSLDHVALLAALDLRDEGVARALMASAAKAAPPSAGVKSAGGVLTVPIGGQRVLRFEVKKKTLALSVAADKLAQQVSARFGRAGDTLAASKPFLSAKSAAPPAVHALSFTDYSNLVKGSRLLPPANAAGLHGAVGSFSMVLDPNARGLEIALHAGGDAAGMQILGSSAAMAIYGVRRYLASAKTAEAKNTIGAITRGAAASYERELLSPAGALTHALCGAAQPVPAQVPSGMKYMPLNTAGHDFESGDATHGWRCLRFSINSPIYYQYEYRVGGGYKGPARGCPDPGPNGFEVSAEGDLDGNGKTSLFTRTGKARPDGTLDISPSMCVIDELE